jgi:hypothetical protein
MAPKEKAPKSPSEKKAKSPARGRSKSPAAARSPAAKSPARAASPAKPKAEKSAAKVATPAKSPARARSKSPAPKAKSSKAKSPARTPAKATSENKPASPKKKEDVTDDEAEVLPSRDRRSQAEEGDVEVRKQESSDQARTSRFDCMREPSPFEDHVVSRLQLGYFLLIVTILAVVLSVYMYPGKEDRGKEEHGAWHNLCEGANGLIVQLGFARKFDCK